MYFSSKDNMLGIISSAISEYLTLQLNFACLSWPVSSSVGDNTSIKELKDHAWQLAQDDDDFNMNWLFTYEVLSAADLKDEWKAMKRAGVSFIKDSL
jgi:hypothetical protein